MLKRTVISFLLLFVWVTGQSTESVATNVEAGSETPVTYNFFMETMAFPNGFSLMSILSPVIVMPEPKYDKMLVDALYGKNARNVLIPKFEFTIDKMQSQLTALSLVKESLQADLKDYRKRLSMNHFKFFMFTIGGISVGIGITIGMYYLVAKSTTW